MLPFKPFSLSNLQRPQVTRAETLGFRGPGIELSRELGWVGWGGWRVLLQA